MESGSLLDRLRGASERVSDAVRAFAGRHPVARGAVAPGPRGVPLLGTLPTWSWGDPLPFLTEAARTYGDVVRFPVGPFFFHLLNHPDHIRYVLQEKHHNYPKSANYDELRFVLGNGLLTSEGDFWLRQRRLVQPAFHRQRIAALGASMTEATVDMLDGWDARGSTAAVDVASEMMKLTFRIVGRTLFSTELSDDGGEIGRAITTVLHYTNDRASAVFKLPNTVRTPANVRARKAIAVLDAMVHRVIDERRRDPSDRGDLLSMLLLARDDKTHDGMTDLQVRDEAMTLILAGHETTANNLAWTFYLLSRHPGVLRTLEHELATVLNGRVPTMEDLPKLTYTSCVVQESMRLYPPAWAVERQALEDDEIGGFRIPAGTMVFISPYVIHRHPAYWENPEGFDPERFFPERAEHRPRGVYIPFGAGPRICIGNQFALTEAQLILATVVQRYRLELEPGAVVQPEPTVTLRPKNGVPMRLIRRDVPATQAAAAE